MEHRGSRESPTLDSAAGDDSDGHSGVPLSHGVQVSSSAAVPMPGTSAVPRPAGPPRASGRCKAEEAAAVFAQLFPRGRSVLTRRSIANKVLFRPPQPPLYDIEGPLLEEATGKIPPWRVIDDTLVAMRLQHGADAAAFIDTVTAAARGAAAGCGGASTGSPEAAHLNAASPPPPVPSAPQLGGSAPAQRPTVRRQLEAMADMLCLMAGTRHPPMAALMLRRQALTPRPSLVLVPWRADEHERSRSEGRPAKKAQPQREGSRGDLRIDAEDPAQRPWLPRRALDLPPRPGTNGPRRTSNSAASPTGAAAAAVASTDEHQAPSRARIYTGCGEYPPAAPAAGRRRRAASASCSGDPKPDPSGDTGSTGDGDDDEACAFIPTLVVGPSTAQSVTLYCHGNAADLGMISHVVQAHAAACNTLVVAVDYPGYGAASTGPYADDGCASDEACVASALRVLRFLLSTPVSALASAGPTVHESTAADASTTEEISETLSQLSPSRASRAAASPVDAFGGSRSPGAGGRRIHSGYPGFRSDSGSENGERSEGAVSFVANPVVLPPPMAPTPSAGDPLTTTTTTPGASQPAMDAHQGSTRRHSAAAAGAAGAGAPAAFEGVDWARSSTSRGDPTAASAGLDGRGCASSAGDNPALASPSVGDDLGTSGNYGGGGGSHASPGDGDPLHALPAHRPVTLDRVVLCGQSIGTGVVMQLLRLIRRGAVADLDPRRAPCAVILHSPFTSVKGITRGAEECDGAAVDAAVARAGTTTRTGTQDNASIAAAERAIEEQLSCARDAREVRKQRGGNDAFVCDQLWVRASQPVLADRLRSIDTILEAYTDGGAPLPPFLLIHGEDDTLIPVTHTLLLARAILHCPRANGDISDARGRVVVAVKPGCGHNDVLLLEAKGAFHREYVDERLAATYFRADGSPEPLPPTLVAALDRRAVPHHVGAAVHRRAVERRDGWFSRLGVANLAMAVLLLLLGAVSLPVVMYGPANTVGVCNGTDVVGAFGPQAIGSVLRIALGLAANGVGLLGYPTVGIHRTIPESAKAKAISYHLANLLNGLMILLGVPLAAYDAAMAHRHAGAMWGDGCAWATTLAPALVSLLYGAWSLATVVITVVCNH